MTSEADRGGKVDHRRERRNQLHEAGASALAAGSDHSRFLVCRRRKAKAKRLIITGIATGCARA